MAKKQTKEKEEKKVKEEKPKSPDYISKEDKAKHTEDILKYAEKFNLTDGQLSKVLSTAYYTVRDRIKGE